MSADLDPANLPSVQVVESPVDTWANHRDTASDWETVFAVGMEMAVYVDGRMDDRADDRAGDQMDDQV